MQKFIQKFGKFCIAGLLADRNLLIVATDQFPEDAIPINMEMLSFFDAAPGKADACA